MRNPSIAIDLGDQVHLKVFQSRTIRKQYMKDHPELFRKKSYSLVMMELSGDTITLTVEHCDQEYCDKCKCSAEKFKNKDIILERIVINTSRRWHTIQDDEESIIRQGRCNPKDYML